MKKILDWLGQPHIRDLCDLALVLLFVFLWARYFLYPESRSEGDFNGLVVGTIIVAITVLLEQVLKKRDRDNDAPK